MKRWRNIRNWSTSIEVNESYEGEPIEIKVKRMVENGIESGDSAPLIYTERREGVVSEYNPRTDKWDVALNAMSNVSDTHRGQRAMRIVKSSGAQGADESKHGQTADNE